MQASAHSISGLPRPGATLYFPFNKVSPLMMSRARFFFGLIACCVIAPLPVIGPDLWPVFTSQLLWSDRLLRVNFAINIGIFCLGLFVFLILAYWRFFFPKR
jgi:hypothetical protein